MSPDSKRQKIVDYMQRAKTPRTVNQVVKAAGVSRQYVYKLMSGELKGNFQKVGRKGAADLYLWDEAGDSGRESVSVGRVDRVDVGSRPAEVLGTRDLVVHTLQGLGGRIEDRRGRAAHALMEASGQEVNPKTLMNMLKRLEDEGVIRREGNQTRTKAIELVDFVAVDDDGGMTVIEVKRPEPTMKRLLQASDMRADGRDDDGTSDDLAYRLLGLVVQALAADEPELKGRLSEALAERQRLAEQIRRLGDELATMKYERDGLKQRLRQAEANIDAMVREVQKMKPGPDARKQLERFMQEKPRGR